MNFIDKMHEINMRKYYIDNIRWITILLLVPYHAAMAWNVWGEPNYIFFENNKIISSIVVFFSPYFMPLMFFIAGISTRSALQKRTIGQYVLERAKKLLIPFIFGTVLIMPPMTYMADKFNYGYQGNLFQHYAVFFTHFTDLTGADGGFSAGQFWFILYLFLISLIAAGIILLQRKIMHLKDIPFLMWTLRKIFVDNIIYMLSLEVVVSIQGIYKILKYKCKVTVLNSR